MRLCSIALVCALAGCGGADATGPTSSGDVAITVTPEGDVHRGSNTFTVKLAAGSIAPGTKEHTSVEVTPWMPAMGHGASTDPTIVETGPGSFRVDEVMFSMPGTWELRVKVASDVGSGTSTFRYEIP